MTIENDKELDVVNRRFREIRTSLGLTQLEFAKELEVRQGHISHIENGTASPSPKVLMRLSKLYPHINMNWLILGHGAKIKDPNKEMMEKARMNEDMDNMKKEYERIIALKDDQLRVANERIAHLEKTNEFLMEKLK